MTNWKILSDSVQKYILELFLYVSEVRLNSFLPESLLFEEMEVLYCIT